MGSIPKTCTRHEGRSPSRLTGTEYSARGARENWRLLCSGSSIRETHHRRETRANIHILYGHLSQSAHSAAFEKQTFLRPEICWKAKNRTVTESSIIDRNRVRHEICFIKQWYPYFFSGGNPPTDLNPDRGTPRFRAVPGRITGWSPRKTSRSSEVPPIPGWETALNNLDSRDSSRNRKG